MQQRFRTVHTSRHDTPGIAGDLISSEYYEQEDAKECTQYAELILEGVKEFTGK